MVKIEAINRQEAIAKLIERINHIKKSRPDNLMDRAHILGLEAAIAIVKAIPDSNTTPAETVPTRSMSLQEIVEESQGQYSLHWKAMKSLAECLMGMCTIHQNETTQSEIWNFAQCLASETGCRWDDAGRGQIKFIIYGYDKKVELARFAISGYLIAEDAGHLEDFRDDLKKLIQKRLAEYREVAS